MTLREIAERLESIEKDINAGRRKSLVNVADDLERIRLEIERDVFQLHAPTHAGESRHADLGTGAIRRPDPSREDSDRSS